MEATATKCQCSGCWEWFDSTRSFDDHRTGRYAKLGEWQGTRRCLTPEEMTRRRMAKNEEGYWLPKPAKKPPVGRA